MFLQLLKHIIVKFMFTEEGTSVRHVVAGLSKQLDKDVKFEKQ